MGLVADVFTAQLNKSNGDILALSTLQDANIDFKVQETDVRSGQGNNIRYTIHTGRDITISLTDAEFRYDVLSTQLGSDIVTGAGVAFAQSKFYTVATVSTNKQITLDNSPITGTLALYDATGTKLALTTDYTVSGAVVTILASGVSTGDKVEARSYQYNTDATTESIEINAKNFAQGVQLVLSTMEINDQEQPIATIQYIFDNCIPDGNFQMNTKSDKSAYTQAMTMKVVKPANSDVVGRILRIPVTA